MKGLIVTGGTIDDGFAAQYIRDFNWDFIISADSGMNFCYRAEILPDLILGDFDSADPKVLKYYRERCPERIEQFPTHKDETDTELALIRAIKAGADEITVIGATGTRLDHVLGNIQLLKMALDARVSCMLVDAHNRIRMMDYRKTLELKKTEQFGKYVSLLPFTPEVTGLNLEGFVYNVEDFTLTSGIARGVSNEIVEEKAYISCLEGILLVIESMD